MKEETPKGKEELLTLEHPVIQASCTLEQIANQSAIAPVETKPHGEQKTINRRVLQARSLRTNLESLTGKVVYEDLRLFLQHLGEAQASKDIRGELFITGLLGELLTSCDYPFSDHHFDPKKEQSEKAQKTIEEVFKKAQQSPTPAKKALALIVNDRHQKHTGAISAKNASRTNKEIPQSQTISPFEYVVGGSRLRGSSRDPYYHEKVTLLRKNKIDIPFLAEDLEHFFPAGLDEFCPRQLRIFKAGISKEKEGRFRKTPWRQSLLASLEKTSAIPLAEYLANLETFQSLSGRFDLSPDEQIEMLRAKKATIGLKLKEEQELRHRNSR